MDKYIVYVKTDERGVIVEVGSSAFVANPEGWISVDEGEGDSYRHAQSQYLDVGLTDDLGVYNYKLVDGKLELRTTEEKAPELAHIAAEQEISELKSKLAATDYIAAKIAEGAATREEYAEQIAQRADWRTRVNELEGT